MEESFDFEGKFPSLKGKEFKPYAEMGYEDPEIRWDKTPIPGMKTKGALQKEPKVLTQEDIDEGKYYYDCVKSVDIKIGQAVFLKEDIQENCLDKQKVREIIDGMSSVEFLGDDWKDELKRELGI